MMLLFLALIGSYLTGSICSAVIVCRLCGLADPRSEGSRNPGTTNVLRLAGKKYALIVLLADLGKGFIPVCLVKFAAIMPQYWAYIGLAAIVGHIYPIFFRCKGGKGVATMLGVLFALHLGLGTLAVVTWLVVAWISGYSSLAAIIALTLSPLYALILPYGRYFFLPLLCSALLVLYQHRDNIHRLRRGEESKIKF